MKTLLGSFAFLIVAGFAVGDTVGVANSDGFTLSSDGYYYWPDGSGTPYTREPYTTRVYSYSQRCYVNRIGYIYNATAKKEYPVSYKDPEWRAKLLEIAAQRDKVEGEARRAAFEQSAFLEGVQALGLQGNFRWNGYGTSPAYPSMTMGSGNYGSSYQLGPHGANGQTVYGYSYSSVADLYGSADLNVLYQQASRLTQNAQTLAGQANTDFSDLVAREGNNRARVAEILAKQQAVKLLLDGLRGDPKATVKTREFMFKGTVDPGTGKVQVEQVPDRDPPPEPKQSSNGRLSDSDFMGGIVMPSCASCHSGKDAKGGFVASSYLKLSSDQKAIVRARVMTTDPEKRMPRNKDGGPGIAQTEEQVKQWLLH